MWIAVWLSRSSNLYEATRFSFLAGRDVSLTPMSEFTTSPFSELTGTTGVVASVRNASFWVPRPYDPLTTSFVAGEKVRPPVAENWLKLLSGALLIVLLVNEGLAQFCHESDLMSFRKKEP